MKYERVVSLVNEAIRRACKLSNKLTRDDIMSRDRVASGKWLKNIFYNIKQGEDVISIQYAPKDMIDIGKNADWDVRNKGLGAGKGVSFDKILQWVKDKKIAYTGKGSSKRTLKHNQKSAAFFITKKIRDRGTSFQHKHASTIYDKNYELLYDGLNKEINKTIDKIIDDSLDTLEKALGK